MNYYKNELMSEFMGSNQDDAMKKSLKEMGKIIGELDEFTNKFEVYDIKFVPEPDRSIFVSTQILKLTKVYVGALRDILSKL